MSSLKILIPTDFSVQAEYAYIMVKNLESKIPVDIHFLHVLQVPDTVTMDEEGNVFTCGDIDVSYVEKQRDIALRNLNHLKSIYGENIHVHLRFGTFTDATLQFGAENKIDLIVTGTKGAFGLKEKISGSSTQYLARKSRIPVLSLMCDRADLQINNILFVHDFSKTEKMDLSIMQKLINSFHCHVHFLQITNGDPVSERAEYELKADSFAHENNIENFTFHILHDKDVEAGVAHLLQLEDMDIICIGTHGKGGLFHASATEKLINHLFKPIISFHIETY
jgi:nucleotide-binding universal stress UspA family protein